MLSIFETGGKQYLVRRGDKIKIEKIQGNAGDKISFDKILFASDGKEISIGKPFIAGATVEGKVLKQGRGDKIRVFKYKAKSKYRRTIGHRQHFTEIEITKI